MSEEFIEYQVTEQPEAEENDVKSTRKRISIRDDIYREFKDRARREKYSPNKLAEKIFLDYLEKCR